VDIHFLWKTIRILITAVYLMGAWLLFTFSLEPYSLLLGFVLSFLIALFTYDLFIDVQEAERKALVPHVHLFLLYVVVLLKSIVWSSVKMIPLLFTLNMKPRIVHLRTRVRSDIARALLANSITLTPGTLTIDLNGDNLLVHWLDAKTTHRRYAGELIKDHLERWLRRIWT